jgi:hypothetical protein
MERNIMVNSVALKSGVGTINKELVIIGAGDKVGKSMMLESLRQRALSKCPALLVTRRRSTTMYLDGKPVGIKVRPQLEADIGESQEQTVLDSTALDIQDLWGEE